MGYWGGFAPYVSVAEKREKAAKKLKRLQKSNPAVRPVLIQGSVLARTWWGKSWNKNLERYADYGNRIGRGRSYVRHGAVLDLQIRPGDVAALVQGSRSQPYLVNVHIRELAQGRWGAIKAACAGKLDSLPELLAGNFPRTLGEVFMVQGKGLFPAPAEIRFSCSCPDWASMCKHVAAVLYGIGARLDDEPGLFFTLRGVHVPDLISEAVADTTRDLLRKSEKKSRRILREADLGTVFGIELDSPGMAATSIYLPKQDVGTFVVPPVVAPTAGTPASGPAAASSTDPRIPATVVSAPLPARGRRKSASQMPKPAIPEPHPARGRRKTTATVMKPVSTKLDVSKRRSQEKIVAKKPSPLEVVEKIILGSRGGIDTAGLILRTGLEAQKIRNLVQRLRQQNKIRNISRGVYGK